MYLDYLLSVFDMSGGEVWGFNWLS